LNRKLRILHFIYDHPDNPWCSGGGARRTWEINSILASRHDITVFCGGFPGAVPQEEPFKVRFLGNANRYIESRLKYILGSISIDAGAYDLVIEDFSAYAPVFPRLKTRPRVTILHAYYGLSALRYRGLYGLIAVFGERILLPRRSFGIAVSQSLRERTLRNTGRWAVIGQGVTVPPNLPPSSEEYVLFLGRLDIRVKGIDLLLKAWSLIAKKKRTLPLYIAGGGDRKTIRSTIAEKGLTDIRLLGRLDHLSAMATITRAAFVCIPSRSEGFSLVTAEALALGKPVIVSSIPALKALVPHGIAGLCVPPEDPYLLSKAVERLLSDSTLRRQLAKGARELGSRYSWKEVAERQEKFYLECLGKNRLRK